LLKIKILNLRKMQFERTENKVIFVYGTLKRNEPNHSLLADRNNVKFISDAVTIEKWPLIIATERNVPYLLNEKNLGKVIKILIAKFFIIILKVKLKISLNSFYVLQY